MADLRAKEENAIDDKQPPKKRVKKISNQKKDDLHTNEQIEKSGIKKDKQKRVKPKGKFFV